MEYFLFLLHPAPRIAYTPREETHKKNRIENLKVRDSNDVG